MDTHTAGAECCGFNLVEVGVGRNLLSTVFISMHVILLCVQFCNPILYLPAWIFVDYYVLIFWWRISKPSSSTLDPGPWVKKRSTMKWGAGCYGKWGCVEGSGRWPGWVIVSCRVEHRSGPSGSCACDRQVIVGCWSLLVRTVSVGRAVRDGKVGPCVGDGTPPGQGGGSVKVGGQGGG